MKAILSFFDFRPFLQKNGSSIFIFAFFFKKAFLFKFYFFQKAFFCPFFQKTFFIFIFAFFF